MTHEGNPYANWPLYGTAIWHGEGASLWYLVDFHHWDNGALRSYRDPAKARRVAYRMNRRVTARMRREVPSAFQD